MGTAGIIWSQAEGRKGRREGRKEERKEEGRKEECQGHNQLIREVQC